jgi:hypothetical protein
MNILPFFAIAVWSHFPMASTSFLTHKTAPVPTFRLKLTVTSPRSPSFLLYKAKEGQEEEQILESKDYSNLTSRTYSIISLMSTAAWIATSYVALSYHPDPKFADCSLRHNLLTMSQAFAFPLSIMIGSYNALRTNARSHQSVETIGVELNVIMSVLSFSLAASSVFAPLFAFGYDLYSFRQKFVTSTIHILSGLFTSAMAWKEYTKQSTKGTKGDHTSTTIDQSKNSTLYYIGSFGMLYFAIQPFLVSYPLATIPTILGKRLSRPASIFTLLGSYTGYILGTSSITFSIRESLRVGLLLGTGSHLLLVILKLVGVDGGGLILQGRGLWDVYPAMMSVPFSAGASMIIYGILCLASWLDRSRGNEFRLQV